MNGNSLLQQLRETTGELHDRIEKKNPAQAILDHSITLKAYKQLLLQNYTAYRQLEYKIAAFLPFYKADKSARLSRDLEALKIFPDLEATDFEISSVPEAFGAAYVLEGSALGGLYIAKHLPQCEQLKGLAPQHFFSREKSSLNPWKLFKEELAVQNFNEAQTSEMLSKARETFVFFENSYGLNLIKT